MRNTIDVELAQHKEVVRVTAFLADGKSQAFCEGAVDCYLFGSWLLFIQLV